tara:strand:+ start:312 stop:479 length:168 start_codon:yes stop_codon:yes gene_type:complete
LDIKKITNSIRIENIKLLSFQNKNFFWKNILIKFAMNIKIPFCLEDKPKKIETRL